MGPALRGQGQSRSCLVIFVSVSPQEVGVPGTTQCYGNKLCLRVLGQFASEAMGLARVAAVLVKWAVLSCSHSGPRVAWQHSALSSTSSPALSFWLSQDLRLLLCPGSSLWEILLGAALSHGLATCSPGVVFVSFPLISLLWTISLL